MNPSMVSQAREGRKVKHLLLFSSTNIRVISYLEDHGLSILSHLLMAFFGKILVGLTKQLPSKWIEKTYDTHSFIHPCFKHLHTVLLDPGTAARGISRRYTGSNTLDSRAILNTGMRIWYYANAPHAHTRAISEN